MPREAYPNTGPLQALVHQYRIELCVYGGASPLLSEFIQNSTAEREFMWTSKRMRASGEVLLKSNTMAKHQLKCSSSLHSVVK